MGKPARWLKNVLLGKKPSKSSSSKEREAQRAVNGKEVVVISKIEESDVVSDLPSIGSAAVYTSGMVETQNLEHEDVSDDEIQVSEVQPTDSQDATSVPDDLLSESEKTQQEIAAVTVQAAYRGYLARRAFRILKGIIRLQALFRGHMVRRQAVSTLCCVMGIVRLQALARGREIRHSDIGVEIDRKFQLQHQPLENKLADSVVDAHAYLGIKKLTANTFAQKLLASSPNVMPLHLDNDSSNSIWLENWSASCFWKPVPQPKNASVRKTQKKFASDSQIVEAEFARPKKSTRKVPTSNLDNPSVAQTPFEFEKPKRSFRKVSTNQSIEPLPAMENPQVDLEKVKRGLRKVHNPVVENSIQPQPDLQTAVERPNPGLKEPVNAFEREKEDEIAETVVEQHEDLVQTHGPLGADEAFDSTLVNQIEETKENVLAEEKEDAKEERTPKQNYKKNSARKENQKSGKKGSLVTTTQAVECQESSDGNLTSSAGIPSYMQATKSAKAKLRLQGSSSPKQQETTEKASRRYSLPSSGNSARVTSHSPKTRVSNSGGNNGNKTGKPLLSSREGNGKTIPVEWKR